MNELQRYVAILNKIKTGVLPSKEDQQFFAKYTPDTDSKEFKSQLEVAGMTGDEATVLMEKAYTAGLQNPELKAKYAEQVLKLKKGEIAGNVRTALNTALAAADIITSNKQIKEAQRAARRSQRPQRPAPLTADPLLDRAITEAQQGNFDIARRLAPAQQALLDQYLGDMQTARVASTGQAGAYGALGQVASLRRGRGALGLGAMANQIESENRNRQDRLLGMKLDQNQAIQQSQAQYYPADLQQYGLDQQMAANLGATGRANLRGALPQLGQDIPDMIANLNAKKRRAAIEAAMMPYGKDMAEAATGVDDRVMYTPQTFQPQYLEQMYGYQPRNLTGTGLQRYGQQSGLSIRQ